MKQSDKYLKIVEWSEEDGLRSGESLNSYCQKILKKAVGQD